MQRRLTRRAFLREAACTGAGLVILKGAASARTYAANERVNVALVGVGGRGGWFVGLMPKISNVVAMCDVNEHKAKASYARMPEVPKFADFRVMLDKMDKEIDAVVVSTPDNTHAVISAAAIRHGKGVYVEKPMTHDVFEARALRQLARRYKVATQMGNQGTSYRAFRQAVAILQAGRIGKVNEVHVWSTGGGAGPRPRIKEGPFPVPEYLKWDLWLGPAAHREYHPVWMQWHGWRDFGTGNLGNWATHSSNLAVKGLKVDSLWHADPAAKIRIHVKAEVSGLLRDRFPRWEKIRWELPPRGDMPAVTFHWYNGRGALGVRDRLEKLKGGYLDWGDKGEKKWRDHAGVIVVGSEGVIHSTSHNGSLTLNPPKKREELKELLNSVAGSRGHEREWLEAVKGGPAAWSNFDYSGPQTEFLLLGNIATQFEQELEFDPLACKILNNAEADNLLRRECRVGWSL